MKVSRKSRVEICDIGIWKHWLRPKCSTECSHTQRRLRQALSLYGGTEPTYKFILV